MAERLGTRVMDDNDTARDSATAVRSRRPAGLRQLVDGYHAALVAIALASGGLAMIHLGRPPLWRDEAWAYANANRSLVGVFRVLWHREFNMGLYFLLLHPWRLFGSGEVWLRTLSVVFAALAVLVFAATVGRLLGRRAAIISGLMLGLNPFFIRYAREARAYSLVLLLAACASYCFVRAWSASSTDRRWRILYVISVIALAYAHILGPLIVLGHIAVLFVAKRWSRQWTVSYTVAAAGIAPFLAWATLLNHSNVSWIDNPSVKMLSDFVTTVAGSKRSVFVLVVIMAWGVVAGLRSGRQVDRLVVIGALASSVGPVAAVWAFSHAKPLFVDRYLIFVLLGVAVLLAYGIMKAPGGIVVSVILTLLLCVHFVRASREVIDTAVQVEDVRSAVQYVGAKGQSGDVLLFNPSWSRVSFDYYTDRFPIAPRDVSLAPNGRPTQVGDVLAREVDPTTLDQRLVGTERIWVVGHAAKGWRIAPEPAAAVEADHVASGHWVKVDEERWGEFSVILYQVRS